MITAAATAAAAPAFAGRLRSAVATGDGLRCRARPPEGAAGARRGRECRGGFFRDTAGLSVDRTELSPVAGTGPIRGPVPRPARAGAVRFRATVITDRDRRTRSVFAGTLRCTTDEHTGAETPQITHVTYVTLLCPDTTAAIRRRSVSVNRGCDRYRFQITKGQFPDWAKTILLLARNGIPRPLASQTRADAGEEFGDPGERQPPDGGSQRMELPGEWRPEAGWPRAL